MPFVKPENALERAKEFIDVGKKHRALDTLYEVIKSKRHRSWQKIHEPIMQKYLELCVDLKESHLAKDGLHQYKTICQNVNVKSLEDVIVQYLSSAEEQANKAKNDAHDAVVDVDDLEVLNSPETLLLKAVSGESSQDRADRDVLAPWLKFVWESYKQCLDLLKNNNKLEQLYQQVAKQAFQFCFKYGRKTEFRKLCETIRQHMVQSQKYQNQPTSIDLSKPETQNYHLETRLSQLNHAITMELWQEAYKAVEDIYGLMNLSKTKPKPQQMFNYYSKLSLVFWKAGNHLFHAATLQKLFVLIKEQKKNISNEELTKISTKVLLATLSIPIPLSRSPIDECLDTDEITIEKLKRLSGLLNLQQAPTRTSLLKDLIKYNVIQYVYAEVKDLYEWLEVEFNPLKLSTRVNQCLEYLNNKNDPDTAQYVISLKDIAVMRLLKQISQVYTSIEIARFIELAPVMDKFHLEKVIVDAAKNNDLQIRINHQTKSLHFGNDLYVAQREELPEGPNIQSMPSEQIRSQLIAMSQALFKSVELIDFEERNRKRQETSANIATIYRQICDKHHSDLLKRKAQIETQKEMYEQLANERDQLEQRQLEIEGKKNREEEEKIRKKRVEETKIRVDQNLIRDLKDKTGINIGIEEKEEQEEKLKKIEQIKKEKKDFDDKLKKEEKKLDHFVRACHEFELPILVKYAEEDAEVRRKFWDQKGIERFETSKIQKQIQSENRDRILRMINDKEEYYQIFNKARSEEYQKKLNEFQAKLNSARETKLAERKEKRKLDRKQKHQKEIEDKKKREEDEERRRVQDAQSEKQRLRELEIEKKLEKAKIDTRTTERPDVHKKEAYKPVTDAGEGWRRGPPPKADENELPARNRADEPYRPRFMRDADADRGVKRDTRVPEKSFDEWRVKDNDSNREAPPPQREIRRDDRDVRRDDRSAPTRAWGPTSKPGPPSKFQDSGRADNASSWRRKEESPQRSPDRDERRTIGGSGSRGGKSYKEERSIRINNPRDDERSEKDQKGANPSSPDAGEGWTKIRGKK